MSRLSCSRESINSGEQMFGTAPRVDVWLLIEYGGVWGRKAFPASSIPDAAKNLLGGWLNAIPNSRLQLIKRRRNSEEGLKFYVAASSEREPKLFEFTIAGYADLLGFDIGKILCGVPTPATTGEGGNIFAVCAHGSHDACCGTLGAPVYLEAERGGNPVWQSTHLGGHRFAPTLVCLPEGIYHGRVSQDGVCSLMSRHKKGLITPQSYRGRSCYSAEAQAAEFFLRRETGLMGLSEFRLIKSQRAGDSEWTMEFGASGGGIYNIRIGRNSSALKLITSCGDDEKSPVAQFELLDFRIGNSL
ncbi:MAG: sucrase ferredoxin [Deltaproteobacteria bacterium]